MNCCTECFQDTEVRAMITKNGQIGECSFCGNKNISTYPVDKQTDLSDLISEVINTYEKSETDKPLFQYASTMTAIGDNIAIFDESLFKCESVHNVEIKEIHYNSVEI